MKNKKQKITDCIKDTIRAIPYEVKSSELNLHLGAVSYKSLQLELNLEGVKTFGGMDIICKPEYPLNSIVISPK